MKHVRLCKIYFLKAVRFFKKSSEEFIIAIALVAIYLAFGSFELKEQYQSYRQYISNFSKWANELDLKRSIASIREPQCLDILDKENLKEEIKRLEKKNQTGQEFNGNWQGVNLSELMPSQAKLLSDYGHLIGNKSYVQNFSSCSDVICIFNEIYQDNEKEAGLYVYYWYLKTGSMLAMSNIIPAQKSKFPGIYNDQKFALKDYLFSKSALRELVQIAYELPSHFSHNPFLRSFVKIPDTQFERKDINSCVSLMRSGNALINESCLKGDSQFKKAILNTIISYNDLYQGESFKAPALSASSHFLSLGFWEEEPFLNDDLRWTHKWNSSLKENPPSPQDFYEGLIYNYVFSQALFTQKTPMDIARFVESDLFQGVAFDPLTLSSNILKTSINNWDKKEVSLWKECLEDNKACYSQDEISSFIKEEKRKIASASSYGCRFLTSPDYEIGREKYVQELKKHIEEKLIKHKFEKETFKEKAISYQNAMKAFKDNIDPIFALIRCEKLEDKKECYESFLLEKASMILNAHHIQSEVLIKKGQEEMLGLYPYELILQKNKELMANFLSPYLMKSYFAAKKIVSVCKKLPINPREEIHFPLTFRGGMRYIEATTLNCINSSLPNMIREVVESEKRITLLEVEKNFIAIKIKHYFSNSLESILEKEEIIETQKLALRYNNIEEEFLTKLKKEDSLIKESYSKEELKRKCLKEVSLQANQKIFYHSEKEIEEKFGRTICSQYLDDPKVEKKLQAEIEKKWQKSLKWANETFQSVFSLETEKCQSRYPATSDAKFKNQRLKEICEKEAFRFAENYTKSLWKKHSEAKAFKRRMDGVEF